MRKSGSWALSRFHLICKLSAKNRHTVHVSLEFAPANGEFQLHLAWHFSDRTGAIAWKLIIIGVWHSWFFLGFVLLCDTIFLPCSFDHFICARCFPLRRLVETFSKQNVTCQMACTTIRLQFAHLDFSSNFSLLQCAHCYFQTNEQKQIRAATLTSWNTIGKLKSQFWWERNSITFIFIPL